jgi:protein-tyrosine phosphatase
MSTDDPSPIKLCFVCLGNICRSPTAEGVMLHLVREAGLSARFAIDSAGTGAYHAGERADPRSRAEAQSRGVDLPSIARQFTARDFDEFDYVIAMDRKNRLDLSRLANGDAQLRKLHLLRSFDPRADDLDVPDPYYGGDDGFARVFEICEAGCRGLLAHLRVEHRL